MKVEVDYILRVGEETYTFSREELKELYDALRVIFNNNDVTIPQYPIYRQPDIWTTPNTPFSPNKQYTEVTCQSLERNL